MTFGTNEQVTLFFYVHIPKLARMCVRWTRRLSSSCVHLHAVTVLAFTSWRAQCTTLFKWTYAVFSYVLCLKRHSNSISKVEGTKSNWSRCLTRCRCRPTCRKPDTCWSVWSAWCFSSARSSCRLGTHMLTAMLLKSSNMLKFRNHLIISLCQ